LDAEAKHQLGVRHSVIRRAEEGYIEHQSKDEGFFEKDV
jgi:hypothetical protein